jgi:hypothetical protein
VQDQEAAQVVRALQVQVTRDFYPAWGINAGLHFVVKGTKPRKGAWQIVILDNSDQAGALGYHDQTAEGLPIGKVFAATDLQYGMKWSVTASHELVEMLADPNINLTVFREDIGQLWSYEVGDACESDADGYDIDGITVSDFVYPEWFEGFWPVGGAKFDHLGKIDRPFGLLPGGYIGYFDLRSGNGWQQMTARTLDHAAAANRAPVGSRRERRRTPKDQWVRSRQ